MNPDDLKTCKFGAGIHFGECLGEMCDLPIYDEPNLNPIPKWATARQIQEERAYRAIFRGHRK